jgi:hypothetical protein
MGRDYLGNLDVDGRITNTEVHLIETGCDSVNWIRLAHDRVQKRPLVNAIINPWVSLDIGNYLTS